LVCSKHPACTACFGSDWQSQLKLALLGAGSIGNDLGSGSSFCWAVNFVNSNSLFLVLGYLAIFLGCGIQFTGQFVVFSGLKCAVISLFWPYLLSAGE